MKCSYKNGILKTESIHDIFLPLSFAQDRCGTIWVGTYSPKLYAKKRKEKEFVQTKVFSWTGTFIPGLLPRNNGKMWTTAFMNPVMQINPDNWESAEVPFENTDWQACIQRSVFILPTSSKTVVEMYGLGPSATDCCTILPPPEKSRP